MLSFFTAYHTNVILTKTILILLRHIGMCLTAIDAGLGSSATAPFRVFGPSGLNAFWRATRHFMRKPAFNIQIRDLSATSKNTNLSKRSECGKMEMEIEEKETSTSMGEEDHPLVARGAYLLRKYDEISVYSLGYSSSCNNGISTSITNDNGTSTGTSNGISTNTPSSDTHNSHSSHICYIVETSEMAGKFDLATAKALGVPPGPLYVLRVYIGILFIAIVLVLIELY